MTYKYPSSGYGMSAPSAQSSLMNKLAASNNAAAGTSSWKMPAPSWSTGSTSSKSSGFPSLSSFTSGLSSSFPSLKGATGNTLYPAPKTSSSSYPSVADYFGKLTASSPVTQSWAASNTGSGSKSLQMPAGFSQGLFGSSASQGATGQAASNAQTNQAFGNSLSQQMFDLSRGTNTAAQAQQHQQATQAQQQQRAAPPMTGGAPAAPRSSNAYPTGAAPQPDHTKSNAGGIAYTARGDKPQTHSSVTGPGALQKGIPSASSQQAVDQWGRTFYHNDTSNAGGQIVGVSNHGSVLRSYTDSRGVTHTYDTGVAAFQPVQSAPAAPPPAPVVGRPTQAHQPVSTPVIQPRQPTQDEIDAANQGRWLV